MSKIAHFTARRAQPQSTSSITLGAFIQCLDGRIYSPRHVRGRARCHGGPRSGMNRSRSCASERMCFTECLIPSWRWRVKVINRRDNQSKKVCFSLVFMLIFGVLSSSLNPPTRQPTLSDHNKVHLSLIFFQTLCCENVKSSHAFKLETSIFAQYFQSALLADACISVLMARFGLLLLWR
jgi:hypothetical protein